MVIEMILILIWKLFFFVSNRGPMEEGIHPREASDRLNIYQARFDELWRKYTTYSGGEELFGLSVTQYPELQRIRKELNLLQKLYQLYNIVLENVNGYQDIPWVEIDIEKINNELLDFGNKYVLKELVDTEAVPLNIILEGWNANLFLSLKVSYQRTVLFW